jgi:hypothetical protein
MSDRSLRELERRWKATAAAADEAEFVRERIRTLRIGSTQLEVAAHCGSRGVLEALGQRSNGEGDMTAWVLSMHRWGRPVLVRALAALCTLASERVAPRVDGLRALRAVEEWLTTNQAKAVEEARHAGLAIARPESHDHALRREVELAIRDTVAALLAKDFRRPARGAVRHACAVVTEDEARQAVSTRLIAWALESSAD